MWKGFTKCHQSEILMENCYGQFKIHGKFSYLFMFIGSNIEEADGELGSLLGE